MTTTYKSRGGQALPPKKSKGKGGVLGLFPSTAVTQPEIARLLGTARTQVKQNFAGSELPPQQSYLQPYQERRDTNLQLADSAGKFLQAASANAQNLSGAFTSAVAQQIAGNKQSTLQGGGSGLVEALPAPAVETIPMNMIGSSWTNLLNAQVPAQAARAQEANQATDVAQSRAISDYNAARTKRTSDIESAISTLYKSNLDTLQTQKDDAYKNAVALYSVLGRQAYLRAQAKERAREFGVTSGQRDRSLDQADARIANTEAYRQQTLNIQRQKAVKETGVDTGPALKILLGGKLAASGGLKLGPQGQLGGNYLIYPLLQTAADSPTGQAIYNTKSPIKKFVKYGEQVPVTGQGGVTGRVTLASLAFPHSKAGQARGATSESYRQAVNNLRAKYGAKITAEWLATYFPPPPGVA